MSLNFGVKGPAFTGYDQDGNSISLKDFTGKKLVMFFYPKDNTPGCTAQACNLRDNYDSLLKQGYAVVGISPDSEASHQKFIAKHELPFPLIADTEKEIHGLYDTWKEKQMYGKTYMGTVRTTFVIDENGVITEILEGRKVKTKDHAAQIIG